MHPRLLPILILSAFAFPLPSFARTLPASAAKSMQSARYASRKVKVNVPGYASFRTRNEQRKLDLKMIGNIFFDFRTKYLATKGTMIPLDDIEICNAMLPKDCKGMLDLRALMNDQTLVIPADPGAPRASKGTRYFVHRDWKDRYYLTAPDAEEGWTIKQQN